MHSFTGPLSFRGLKNLQMRIMLGMDCYMLFVPLVPSKFPCILTRVIVVQFHKIHS